MQPTFQQSILQATSHHKNVFLYKNNSPYTSASINRLAQQYSLQSILVEGGSQTQAAFVRSGLFHRLHVYISLTKILADGNNALSPFSKEFLLSSSRSSQTDPAAAPQTSPPKNIQEALPLTVMSQKSLGMDHFFCGATPSHVKEMKAVQKKVIVPIPHLPIRPSVHPSGL